MIPGQPATQQQHPGLFFPHLHGHQFSVVGGGRLPWQPGHPHFKKSQSDRGRHKTQTHPAFGSPRFHRSGDRGQLDLVIGDIQELDLNRAPRQPL